jgi:hypothetical protein
MRINDKHFGDVNMAFIDRDENDSPKVTRIEYEHLRELVRGLRVHRGDQPNVALSLPMFERILKVIAVTLLLESRE